MVGLLVVRPDSMVYEMPLAEFELDTDKLPSWAQPLEGETTSEFKWFLKYLQLPGPRRSIAKLAKESDASPGYLQNRAHDRNWKVRAAAYDSHLELVRLNKIRLLNEQIAEQEVEIGSKFTRLIRIQIDRLLKLAESDEKFVLMPLQLAEVSRIVMDLNRVGRGEASQISQVKGADPVSELTQKLREISANIKASQPEKTEAPQ